MEDESKPHLDVTVDNKIDLASEEIEKIAKDMGLITTTTEKAEDGTESEKKDTSALDALKKQLNTVLAVDENAAFTDADKAAYMLTAEQKQQQNTYRRDCQRNRDK